MTNNSDNNKTIHNTDQSNPSLLYVSANKVEISGSVHEKTTIIANVLGM